MSNRASAVFIVAVLGLVGFNLAELQVLIISYFSGGQLPSTELFRIAFWIWVVTALGSALLGILGGYVAIRTNNLVNRYLTAFCLILCFMIKVDGRELGWSAFRLSLFLGFDHFALGVNIVGVAAYLWLVKLREIASRSLRPLETSDAPNRAV